MTPEEKKQQREQRKEQEYREKIRLAVLKLKEQDRLKDNP